MLPGIAKLGELAEHIFAKAEGQYLLPLGVAIVKFAGMIGPEAEGEFPDACGVFLADIAHAVKERGKG